MMMMMWSGQWVVNLLKLLQLYVWSGLLTDIVPNWENILFWPFYSL